MCGFDWGADGGSRCEYVVVVGAQGVGLRPSGALSYDR